MTKDGVKENNLEDIAGGSTHTRFDPLIEYSYFA